MVKVTTSGLLNPLNRPNIANAPTWHPAAGTRPVNQKKRHSEYSHGCCVCAPKQRSLSFTSLRTLFILVLFYTIGAWLSRRRKTSLWLPTTRPLDAASSAFCGFRVLTHAVSLMRILFSGWSKTTNETGITHQTGTKGLLLIKRSTTYNNISEERMTASD